jgi:DNA-binding GntR family transcriptional regulator
MKLSLQEFAYNECKSLIESGELTPGKLYSEVAMSKQLGISRTPMRTALQNLEKDGLIIRLPQRGFYVYQFTQKDIQELFAIRKALEAYAVETITRKKLAMNIDLLNSHINRQEKALQTDNFTAFILEDRKFHEHIVHALENNRLTTIYSDLRQSIELLGLQRFKVNSQRNLSIKEHKAIVQAIASGDPTASREAVYHHLDSALHLLLKNELE